MNTERLTWSGLDFDNIVLAQMYHNKPELCDGVSQAWFDHQGVSEVTAVKMLGR